MTLVSAAAEMGDRPVYGGIDVGAAYVKVVIIDDRMAILGSGVERSGPEMRSSINAALSAALSSASLPPEALVHITATGFGRHRAGAAHSQKTEISCHAKGAHHYFPRRITVVDIGGQDTKVINLDEHGRPMSFKMNRKCAAGTGAFLEEIAQRLGVGQNELNALAARSTSAASLGSFCTVFTITEVLSRMKDGERLEDLVRGAFESVAKRVIEMEPLVGDVVMTGGVVAHHPVLVEMMREYVAGSVLVPPDPQLVGALGAALFARGSKGSMGVDDCPG
ncbi:MAG: acyl-CoA dehydratase activase [Candidatus Thermoplasmatota archaeon]